MTTRNESNTSILTLIGKFPWMLLVIAYLITVEYLHLSMDGNIGYGFIALAIGALLIEMFKSGDIRVSSFFFDQLWAVISVVLASGLLSYFFFVEGKAPSFYHWAGFSLILADAIINPVNAYRTALRNFGVQD